MHHPKELLQYQAFKDVLKCCPQNEATKPVTHIVRQCSTKAAFQPRTVIPLGWFKDESFCHAVVEAHGATSAQSPMIQLVFNTTPIVRRCVLKTENVEEERFSAPEIVIWTSMGGWSATRADQPFDGPDWTTKFIQL